jgi:DNA-binding NtrC family response regulator
MSITYLQVISTVSILVSMLLTIRKHIMWRSRNNVSIADIGNTLSRDDLLRKSRILIIDDEEPPLKHDLEKEGFSVRWCSDVDAGIMQLIEKMFYDLIILDFSGVGKSLGTQEGLDILKHVKRVAPAVFVLSYTSKSLKQKDGDFYRLTDGDLPKDAGVRDSVEKIETALSTARSAGRLWKLLLDRIDLDAANYKAKTLQETLINSSSKMSRWKSVLVAVEKLSETPEAKAAAIAICRALLQAIADNMGNRDT